MKKTIVSWSGGKDSAIMLERLTVSKNHSVMELFTSISAETGRVPFHGIPQALLEQQAASLDFPIRFVKLPPSPVNKEYEEHMKDFLKLCKKNGAEAISYGDLFQEDIRKYREQLTEECGLEPVFPLWGEKADSIAFECIEKGYKATVCGIDSSILPAECLGMPYSHRFLERLPEAADPCGENGEFHTFVSDGPIFNSSVKFSEDGQDDSLAPFLTLRLRES